MDFVKGLRDRTVFIVGSKKNAGKTTFLNYALNRLRGLCYRSWLEGIFLGLIRFHLSLGQWGKEQIL